MKTQKGKKSFKIRFIIYAILGILTMIPFMGVSKANMFGYYSLCTFTPVSSIILFGLAAMFILKYRKSLIATEEASVKRGKSGPLTVSIILLMLVAVGFGLISMASNQANQYIISNKTQVRSFDQGTYNGEYKFAGLITLARVELEVNEQKIESVDFSKLVNTPTHECKDELIRRVVNKQQLDFDGISGATRTSNFAKAAMVNAFIGNG